MQIRVWLDSDLGIVDVNAEMSFAGCFIGWVKVILEKVAGITQSDRMMLDGAGWCWSRTVDLMGFSGSATKQRSRVDSSHTRGIRSILYDMYRTTWSYLPSSLRSMVVLKGFNSPASRVLGWYKDHPGDPTRS